MPDPQVGGYELITIVDSQVKKTRSRTFDWSFNELLDMYKSDELIIDPEYRRLFRWSEGSQSRFIESLLLEMPMPSLSVIELSEGIYELIDGLQMFSSYLHFRGEHPDRVNFDGSQSKLMLTGCDIAKELNGHTFDSLPAVLQIRLKRNSIRVEVVRRESDKWLRYSIFKRLNTGGGLPSEQETRNCAIRLLDNTFNSFIIDLARNSDFKSCISYLPEEKIAQKGDQELILRFFALKNNPKYYIHDISDFMTDYMEKVSYSNQKSISFDYSAEKIIFEKTFKILNYTLGDLAFSGANAQGNLVANFLSYHYEAFTLGLQAHLDKIDSNNAKVIEKLKEVFLSINNDTEFKAMATGGDKDYANRLRERVTFVDKKVGEIF